MPSTWRSSSTLLVGEEGEGLRGSSIWLVVMLPLSTVSSSTSYATQKKYKAYLTFLCRQIAPEIFPDT